MERSRVEIIIHQQMRTYILDLIHAHERIYDPLYNGMTDVVHSNTYQAVDDRVDDVLRSMFREMV